MVDPMHAGPYAMCRPAAGDARWRRSVRTPIRRCLGPRWGSHVIVAADHHCDVAAEALRPNRFGHEAGPRPQTERDCTDD